MTGLPRRARPKRRGRVPAGERTEPMRPSILLLTGTIGLGILIAAPARAQPACPANFGPDSQGRLLALTCTCPAAAGQSGEVWGTLTYTTDSNLCAAALHAGAIDRRGGRVTVVPMPGRPAYRGSHRNGVQSEPWSAWDASFRFEGVTPPDARICPDTLADREDGGTAPLTCLCPAEQTLRGTIFGTGIYTDDSAICVAAVHAGAITRAGGEVTVVPEPGRDSYPESDRNGVRGSNWDGAWNASYRFHGVPAQPVVPAAPVQSPVATTLRATGQVQLYVRFRTNSAELDGTEQPALRELLDLLRGDTGLRVRLVGHTDSTGAAATNRPLSQRRAESVRAFLVAGGIAQVRLTAAGRGPDQPIADNGTDIGRALNRRVAAERME